MRWDSEKEFEDWLYGHFWTMPDHQLEPMSTLGHLAGAVCFRQLRLPGSSAEGNDGYADLVEFGRGENANGQNCLFAHIIELKNERLKTTDVMQLQRYMTALGVVLQRAKCGGFQVSGTLVGPSASEPIVTMSILGLRRVRLLTFRLDPEGLVFVSAGDDDEYSQWKRIRHAVSSQAGGAVLERIGSVADPWSAHWALSRFARGLAFALVAARRSSQMLCAVLAPLRTARSLEAA
jgi:hypothetical protein